QIKNQFYWISSPLAFDGERRVTEDGKLEITNGSERAVYDATLMSVGEVLPFFLTELSGVLRLSGFYYALLIVSAIFSYTQRYYLQESANRIIRNIRTQVFGQIHRLPIRYFDNLPAGKVVSRVTNDTEAIRELYVTVLANFVSGGVYVFGI